jgi:hypothetical protein
MQTKKCEVCKRKMKVFAFSNRRKTCSPECHSKLAKREAVKASDRKRIATDPTPEQIKEATKHALAFRAALQASDGVPSKKCPCCLRPVRLVNYVAGIVWLRVHRNHTGSICDGSRHVVSYPNERLVEA